MAKSDTRSDGDHDGRVAPEADIEEVGADDVDQVRDNQRQRGRIGHEPAGDDEGESRRRLEVEPQQDGEHDGRQQQGRAVIREDGRDGGPQQHDEGEQPSATPATPPRDVERRPVKEARPVEQERDDDQRHEGEGGVPHDVPDSWDIAGVDDPRDERQGGPGECGSSRCRCPWVAR